MDRRTHEVSKLSDEHPTVELWSSVRLSFEPKGESLAIRADLRAALSELRGTPDQVLEAAYSSQARDPCDIENLLLYNIGTASFRSTHASGIHLRRWFAAPPPSPSNSPYSNHYRYGLTFAMDALGGWSRLARFETRALSPASAWDNPWPVWHTLKYGEVATIGEDDGAARLALQLTVLAPSPLAIRDYQASHRRHHHWLPLP